MVEFKALWYTEFWAQNSHFKPNPGISRKRQDHGNTTANHQGREEKELGSEVY